MMKIEDPNSNDENQIPLDNSTNIDNQIVTECNPESV